MATRRQVRETVVSLLYSLDLGNEDAPKHVDTIFEERKIRNKQREFGKSLFDGIIKNLSELDSKLQAVMKEWEMERIGSIEKAVLRLGAYEILFENQDKAVAINEAVELGKLFGTENSAKFINGVLDGLKKANA